MKGVNYEREMYFSRLIWLFPIAYVFHIMEEAPGFAAWVTNVLGGHMEVRTFYLNNAVFMAVLLTLCYLANRIRKPWSTILLFLWVSAQEFWNFVFHIYAEFRFNAYSPGYFTAIFLYFPVYAYLTYLALREMFLRWGQWILCFVISSFGMFFTIWAGLYHFLPIPWNRWVGWK
jgi:hypothetical protein